MLGLLLARAGVAVTGDEFARLPHREIDTLGFKIQGTQVTIDLSRLPGAHKHIALVPQWDFLELMTTATEAAPTFRLLRSTEVLAPIRNGDKVIGVSYRGAAGETRTMHADLTVACDGRASTLRARGIEELHRGVVSLVPWLAGRIEALTSFDDVKLLDVQLNRLRRWYADGMLLIGDAAHAMSPVGGVGINLAVADAVAAARILAGPLRAGRVSRRRLALVQARRWGPAALVQGVQRIVHAKVIAVAVSADRAVKPPLAVRIVSRIAALRRLVGYAIAIGPLPEHVPGYARR